MVWRGDHRGRVAKSLLVLFDQLGRAYPKRSTRSDGTIGDAAHRSRDSDHNLWYPPPAGGIVTAGDYTHDLANGVDIDRFSDELAASRDPRIKYIIANDLILDSRAGPYAWTWMPYQRWNPHRNRHTSHLHLSVMDSPICDNETPWDLPMLKKGSRMNLDDQVVSQLTGQPLKIRDWIAFSDKWIVETYWATQRIENKVDRILASVTAVNADTLAGRVADHVVEDLTEALSGGLLDVVVTVRDKTEAAAA